MSTEKRFYQSTLSLRERSADDAPGSVGNLTGYIAVFDSDSYDLGGFVERINPGAFKNSLENNDVVCLLNHEHSSVLGRTSSKTLTLSEDATGLKFDVALPDTQAGRDLKTLSQRGDLLGCSFGFVVVDSAWSKRDGVEISTLNEVDLHEVSVGVTFPAYPAASMEMRAVAKAKRGGDRARRLMRFKLAQKKQSY